jgi:release factor glutamine methyltransferase
VALEPSAEAARIAQRNFDELGFSDRIRLVSGRFPEDARGLGPFDGIVSNPPYIESAEVDRLEPELRLFEPRGALDGGPDGLDVLGPLAAEGTALLVPGGLLAVEVARDQAARVAEVFRAHGAWGEPEIIADLAGIPRVVLTRRHSDKESPAESSQVAS